LSDLVRTHFTRKLLAITADFHRVSVALAAPSDVCDVGGLAIAGGGSRPGGRVPHAGGVESQSLSLLTAGLRSHLDLSNPALEFVKTTMHVLALDERVTEEVPPPSALASYISCRSNG
jgi:hypothetical protein